VSVHEALWKNTNATNKFYKTDAITLRFKKCNYEHWLGSAGVSRLKIVEFCRWYRYITLYFEPMIEITLEEEKWRNEAEFRRFSDRLLDLEWASCFEPELSIPGRPRGFGVSNPGIDSPELQSWAYSRWMSCIFRSVEESTSVWSFWIVSDIRSTYTYLWKWFINIYWLSHVRVTYAYIGRGPQVWKHSRFC